jgi:hypothetical protein
MGILKDINNLDKFNTKDMSVFAVLFQYRCFHIRSKFIHSLLQIVIKTAMLHKFLKIQFFYTNKIVNKILISICSRAICAL